MRLRTSLVLAAAAGLLCSVSVPAIAADHGPKKLTIDNFELSGSIRMRGNAFDPDSTIDLNESNFVEQRTRLGVAANVQENLSGMVELDVYSNWGDAFRSDPITGEDNVDSNDVSLYQAYVAAGPENMQLLLGRQELVFGSEWLLGNNDNGHTFTGLSYDAIRLNVGSKDDVNAAIFAAKIGEGRSKFYDDDADLFGIYGNYGAMEGHDVDFYALWLRDDGQYADAAGSDKVDIYTVGLRWASAAAELDYEAEVAYQFGEAKGGLNEFDYGAIGFNGEIGYTFAADMNPRMYLGFAYLQGDDEDAPFNRLFSDVRYVEFDLSRALTNVMIYRVGVGIEPTTETTVDLEWTYLQVVEEVTEDKLGWQLALNGSYNPYANLALNAGLAWFAADNGTLAEPVALNGLGGIGLEHNADALYGYLEGVLSF